MLSICAGANSGIFARVQELDRDSVRQLSGGKLRKNPTPQCVFPRFPRLSQPHQNRLPEPARLRIIIWIKRAVRFVGLPPQKAYLRQWLVVIEGRDVIGNSTPPPV
jgi:hypothetical protein